VQSLEGLDRPPLESGGGTQLRDRTAWPGEPTRHGCSFVQ
jgi:hypothetical protein